MPSYFDLLTLGVMTRTRARASRSVVANALMAEHYARRASAGRLIAEATTVPAAVCTFTGEPGI